MLSKNDIDKIKDCLYECNSIARECRAKGLEISYKEDKSPVTNADIEISKYIRETLLKLYPDLEVICEEGDGKKPVNENFWLIDPIDGTRGYVKGYNIYSINIALVIAKNAEYGFITVPESDRIYYTDENKNLLVEEAGKFVEVERPEEYKAVLSGDHSQRARAHEIMMQHDIANYEYIPCSVKFCLVAAGEADIYPRYGTTMEWDTAAGSALIKAAGGIVNDLDGYELLYNKDGLENKGFIAYSKRLIERGAL